MAAWVKLRCGKGAVVKVWSEVEESIGSGAVDGVGLARALVLDPALPRHWRAGQPDPEFPRFTAPPSGGMTAWYSMRLTDLGENCEDASDRDLNTAIQDYEARDAARVQLWNEAYSSALT